VVASSFMDKLNVLVVENNPKEPKPPLLNTMPDFVSYVEGTTLADFETSLPDAEVILSWGAKRDLMAQLLAAGPKLRWIHSRSAGLDSLMFPALVDSEVPLTNGRGVFSQSLGEFVIGAVLFFAKDMKRMLRSQKEGRWDQFDVQEIRGQTLGIVGYGDIGRAIAKRASAMEMKVLAMRRRPELSAGDPYVTEMFGFGQKKELMERCDYVVSALPLTPETKDFLSVEDFGAMKKSAIFMNVGRGPVVDEPALIAALQSGQIRGAALDVFAVEPLPDGHPFYSMENVLMSAHCADNTAEWLNDAMRFFYQNLDRFWRNEPLLNVVDKRAGY
jgi:phosphoglycerate dehydrogenase-like enzyme